MEITEYQEVFEKAQTYEDRRKVVLDLLTDAVSETDDQEQFSARDAAIFIFETLSRFAPPVADTLIERYRRGYRHESM